MRGRSWAFAAFAVAVVLLALFGMPRGGARSPSPAGSWSVTVGGGQPVYLLVLAGDGGAIATDTRGVTYVGAWGEDDGEVHLDLSTLAVEGGWQGFAVDGPVHALGNGRIALGGDGTCAECWVLSPID